VTFVDAIAAGRHTRRHAGAKYALAVKGALGMRFRVIIAAIVAGVITTALSPLYAQAFEPAGRFAVFDANGRSVGEYVGSGEVFTLINGAPVVLLVTRSSLSSLDLFFDQPGCQGQAFLGYAQDEVETPAAFAPDGTVRLASSRVGSTVTIRSRYIDRASLCSNETSSLANALPSQPGPNLKALFAPPFTLGSAPAFASASVPINGARFIAAIAIALSIIGIVRLR
jgi:hypothetical protein